MTIENIIDSNEILKLSNEKATDIIFEKEAFNIIFVGRLAKEKGLLNAVDALNIVIKKGFAVKWYLIGTGNQQEMIIAKAKSLNILKNIVFLGFQSNPYKYIKQADLFLLPSLYEGKSIALEEAKVLKKLIVVTNFSSAINQIDDRKTGLIATMNSESIATNIIELISNSSLRTELYKNLENSTDNSTEIEKLYKIIG